MEASEGGKVQSIVHGQTVIWVLEAAPETDGEVWVTVKVTKALKGQAFANSAMLEVKEVSNRSDFRANLEISAYDRVITLSTCAYRFENARYVLHGKLVKLR